MPHPSFSPATRFAGVRHFVADDVATLQHGAPTASAHLRRQHITPLKKVTEKTNHGCMTKIRTSPGVAPASRVEDKRSAKNSLVLPTWHMVTQRCKHGGCCRAFRLHPRWLMRSPWSPSGKSLGNRVR